MKSADGSEPRVVVVTGAASGIGHATAQLFREAGDHVFGLDIADGLPDGVTYLRCDVSSKTDIDAAIDTVAKAHGRIDVLANVAGVVQFGHFEGVTEAEWDRVNAIDLKGPFFLIQAALPLLRAAGDGVRPKGTVVNVSSVAGNAAQPYSAAYSAAKGGLTMLTRALAIELSPEGIRVNAICPGTVDTPLVAGVAEIYPADLDARISDRLFALLPGPPSTPAEIAEAIAYLASPAARMMTGTVLAVDGGMAC
ncbi:MAG TPA: SDR family oxidoreductase [Nocardioidaceae bacterium]|nr:SDR family oxidoreductase [Nocardioidaceae bacterium]